MDNSQDIPRSQPSEASFVTAAEAMGDKLMAALILDRQDGIGQDCVAACTNDLVCGGCIPMFFQSVLTAGANGNTKAQIAADGMRRACVEAGCVFSGKGAVVSVHESMVPENEYRLTGFAVGRREPFSGGAMRPGDVIIGAASSGVHAGGFGQILKILGNTREALEERVPELSGTIGEEILVPTKLYAKPFLSVRQAAKVKSASHVRGGLRSGLAALVRGECRARIERSQIAVPPIFDLLARRGELPVREMFENFNMGLGLLFTVAPEEADRALEALFAAGEQGWVIGELSEGSGVELI